MEAVVADAEPLNAAKNADETISGVGMIASQGMKATDDVILSVMLA